VTVDTFSAAAFFEVFSQRDHALCPHCGAQGMKTDEGVILWNDRPKATDHDYTCASCGGAWVIRRYHSTGFEAHAQPPYACIYVPSGRE
jgi:rRNA maturation endonuclease Nob1